jgi:hypothetical protein
MNLKEFEDLCANVDSSTLPPLRKYDPEACLAIVRKYLEQGKFELNTDEAQHDA